MFRTKLERFEEIRAKFLKEVKFCRLEDDYLAEYKAELEQLAQEKMAHVEELRQINSDINQLETTIKQTQVEQQRAVESARHILAEILPLRDEINSLRLNLGKEALPENIINMEYVSALLQLEQQNSSSRLPRAWSVDALMLPQNFSYAKDEWSGRSAMTGLCEPQASAACQSVSQMDIPSAAGFCKQQPPPMKICGSCQQQIHRNAPICPLCKSKSRSRNPKKPKARKSDD
ncbi:unnamed protein product [Soboliphyme baturini]|uniref:C4H2-type domain-containing protein n=1 Tax=Soboliphyme baturini TaxID=241478 RepID=A0A3P8E449_9BILA|nr:unnamed protein product [Soboliphyme baturini]